MFNFNPNNASFVPQPHDVATPNFYCHECHKEVTAQQKEDELICDCCGGSFLEELEIPQPQPRAQPHFQPPPLPPFLPPFFPQGGIFNMIRNINTVPNNAPQNVPNNPNMPQIHQFNVPPNPQNFPFPFPFPFPPNNQQGGGQQPQNNPQNNPQPQNVHYSVFFGGGGGGGQNPLQDLFQNLQNPQNPQNQQQQQQQQPPPLGINTLFDLIQNVINGNLGNLVNIGMDDGEENFQNIINQLFERYVCPEPPPADKEFVARLPRKVFDHFSFVGEDEMNSCAVCKDDFNVGDKALELPCSHIYHEDCIMPWLSKRHTCPVCRYELPQEKPSEQKKSDNNSDSSTHSNIRDDDDDRHNEEDDEEDEDRDNNDNLMYI